MSITKYSKYKYISKNIGYSDTYYNLTPKTKIIN